MRLERFHRAQGDTGTAYAAALGEMRSGRKRSHWIWYIFPQLDGLGHSSTAEFFALHDLDEACAYLRDPVLRARYEEITAAVAGQLEKGVPVDCLMSGATDALKLASSLTLFRAAASRLAQDEAGSEFTRFAQRCDAILLLTATQGFPPCSFTMARCATELHG